VDVGMREECEDFILGIVREFAQRSEHVADRLVRRSALMSAEYFSFAKISGTVIFAGLKPIFVAPAACWRSKSL
jgi:hypothetical protein